MTQVVSPDTRICYPTMFTQKELAFIREQGPDFYLEERLEKMPETDHHHRAIVLLESLLKELFASESNVYAGVPFLYWVPGNNLVAAAPDLFVVKGLPNEPRATYKTWEEDGRTPNVVFEILSPKTSARDRGTKVRIYQDELRVPEYVLFNPIKRRGRLQLTGYRLDGGRYREIEAVNGRLPSEELNVHLEVTGALLRFYDPVEGRLIPTPSERAAEAEERAAEAATRAAEAEERASEAEARAARADREIEILRAELARLRSS